MKLRVIHVNAKTREILETEVETLEDMQALVGGYIERAETLDNGDDVFVNEEGLFEGYDFGFSIGPRLFVGNGFVIGPVDDEGNSTSAKSTVDGVLDSVQFQTIVQEEDRK